MFLIDTNLIVIEVDEKIATDYEPYALGTLEEYKNEYATAKASLEKHYAKRVARAEKEGI